MRKTKAEKEAEQVIARADMERLRSYCPPGKIIYAQLTYVSKSGMLRRVRLFTILEPAGGGTPELLEITWLVAKVCGLRITPDAWPSGIEIRGCGFDVKDDIVNQTMVHLLYHDDLEKQQQGFILRSL